MAESPMKVARILWGSAALMVILAVFFWSGIIDLGIEPWRLALLCGLVAVADLALSAFILTRRRS
jgi:hypothetical protein